MAEAYWLLENEAGYYLRSDSSGDLSLVALADDGCLWNKADRELRSIVSDHRLSVSPVASDPATLVLDDESAITSNGTITLRAGPSALPSSHLTEFRETGLTILEQVIDAQAIERLKTQIDLARRTHHADEPPTDGHFWIMDGLLWSPELATAATHPVALWLIQQYMATDAIHYCHQPIITTLKPAQAMTRTFPDGGWHSDYPYHPGVFPNDDWPDAPVFGVQFNICVDAFTPNSAGTQYLPGSHRSGHWPPDEFNREGTRMGQGVHQQVCQMEAPAGAAILYDARTWHRASHELNQSGRDRIALLNAVAPAWVRPMIDKSPIAENYRATDAQRLLSARTAEQIERLCNSPTLTAPDDAPHLQRPPRPRQRPQTKAGAD